MDSLSLRRLLLRRLGDHRLLIGSIFVSITIATTLVAAAPTYLKALERLGLNLAIDGMRRPFSNIDVYSRNIPLTWAEIESTESSLNEATAANISAIYDGHERYLIVDTYLAGIPRNPLPSPDENRRASRAYFRYFSNLNDHVTYLDRSATKSNGSTGTNGTNGTSGLNGHNGHRSTTDDDEGPALTVDAVVSVATAETFGLRVGDIVTVTQDLGARNRISVRISGIVIATNPIEDYWQFHASMFLDPVPTEEAELPEAGIQYDPDEPPVPLFISQEAMVDGVGSAFPGILVDSLWFVSVDTEPLKKWSIPEVRRRLQGLGRSISRAIPGTETTTGITRMLDEFELRSFFSRVPLLLLLAITAVAVLFYLSMMVAYLVQSRETDVVVLRTRGVGTLQLLRLNSLEGLAMTAVAVTLGPFLAMGIIAIAGKLPYFSDMTAGAFLPVEFGPAPFVAAAGAGFLCLVILVVPGALAARGGLLGHRLRMSRPPRVLLFHRYYLDLALVALGGLIFWELQSRGHLVSGGLFQDIEVNETMLLAPVLFMIMVALVFMRLLPLFVRFIAGESPAIVHLFVLATLLTLVGGIVARETRDGNYTTWLQPAAALIAVGGAYWATSRARMWRYRVSGFILQAGLIAGFLALEPLETDHVLFAPTVGLIFIVPAQVAFVLLVAANRVTPVWLMIGLRNIARNPLQYTWLMVLLVLATGVGVLSTTVGGTLDMSMNERVLYDVGADFRVTGVSRWLRGDLETTKQRYMRIPGVTSVSPALRHFGTVGPTDVEFLALESGEFPYISWYRDDFSALPLSGVMLSLQANAKVDRVVIPPGATTVGAWVKPLERYPNMSMYMVLANQAGAQVTLSLGALGPAEWRQMRAPIPAGLGYPLFLVAVQIFEPYTGEGHVLTNGAIRLDDIHVTAGPTSKVHLLENFEGRMKWTPIATSALSTDRIFSTSRDSYRGNRSALFSFRGESSRGVRGFYQSPTGGPVPVVVSSPFIEATDTGVGDFFMLEVAGMRVPAVVMDTVDYFPTMSSESGRFVLVDLENFLAHLNVLTPGGTFSPNELFLKEAPAAGDSVRETVRGMVFDQRQVHDRGSQLASVRIDPLATAGWNSLELLSLAVLLLAAAFGYLAYLLLFTSRSLGQMAFLQALGLSRRQMMSFLSFEHLAIAAIGLGLGTWAGFQMSRLMVSPLAVTETGNPVVPPFILTTDWSMLLPTYVALLGIFSVSLFVLNRSVSRIDLHTATRGMEG